MHQHVVIRQESYVAGTRERPEVGIFTQTHTSRPPDSGGVVGTRIAQIRMPTLGVAYNVGDGAHRS